MKRATAAIIPMLVCAAVVAKPFDDHFQRMARRLIDSHATSMREYRVTLRDGEWDIVDDAAKRSGMTRDKWLSSTIIEAACLDIVARDRAALRD